jgi:hypothetical protein
MDDACDVRSRFCGGASVVGVWPVAEVVGVEWNVGWLENGVKDAYESVLCVGFDR